jgi:signal transduction histidine kinase
LLGNILLNQPETEYDLYTRIEGKNIEYFFLDTLLKACVVGVAMILASNVFFFPEDITGVVTTLVILLASLLAHWIREKHPTPAVIILTSITLAVVCYQRLMQISPSITLATVIIIGFIFSVMLKGRTMWVMHGIALLMLNTIFLYHVSDPITAAITYSILYFIIAYASAVLKVNYDKIHQHLRHANKEMKKKAEEIAMQNEALQKTQQDLNVLNKNLEQMVSERTAKIKAQNDMLISYSHTNAHHLRGPVARLLGLATIYELESGGKVDALVQKMIEQANEIDAVVKKINADLEPKELEM